jgi:hypothetical protein
MSAVIRSEAEAKYPFKTTTGVDEKAWAKRFVYRAERGDKSLLPIQIKFAYMALDPEQPKAE